MSLSDFSAPLLARLSSMAALVALAFVPTGCGGEAEAGGGPGGGPGGIEPEAAVSLDHSLEVTVDGIRFEARGVPNGPRLMLGLREVNIQVGGAMVGSAGGGPPAGSESELVMTLLANGIEPGDYPLKTSMVVVQSGGEPAGFAKLAFPQEAPFSQLRASSGVITLDAVEGTDDGQRFRLDLASGTVRGTFVDGDSGKHDVEATFTYVR